MDGLRPAKMSGKDSHLVCCMCTTSTLAMYSGRTCDLPSSSIARNLYSRKSTYLGGCGLGAELSLEDDAESGVPDPPGAATELVPEVETTPTARSPPVHSARTNTRRSLRSTAVPSRLCPFLPGRCRTFLSHKTNDEEPSARRTECTISE